MPGSDRSSALSRLVSDQQDPAVVVRVYSRVTQILASGEQILYIAVQKAPANLSPDCAVLTNRRFMIYRFKLLGGVNFEDYVWSQLHFPEFTEGMLRATVTMRTSNGETLSIGRLPKAQARRLCALAKEMVESRRDDPGLYELEYVAPGGVVPQGATRPPFELSGPPQDDPMRRLIKLRELLDAGLITEADFKAKKDEILSEI